MFDVELLRSGKAWFQQETFLAAMWLRRMECNAPSGYGEVFYCCKLVF